jgi:uncharacterized membrane protein YedE/YeeE
VIRGAVSFLAGLTFAAGLCLSGMTRPSKVIGFLDVAGAWDPSLALVMVGAIVVSALAFLRAGQRAAPALGGSFDLPDARSPVTARLVVGAAIFGVGWGLSGLCPGPAVVTLASGQTGALAFVGSMLAGMAVLRLVEGRDRASEANAQRWSRDSGPSGIRTT